MARANQPTAAAVLDLIAQLPTDESMVLAAALAEVANFYGKHGGPMMDTDGEPVYRFVHQFQLALEKGKDSYLARAEATKDRATLKVLQHVLDAYMRAAGDASRLTPKPRNKERDRLIFRLRMVEKMSWGEIRQHLKAHHPKWAHTAPGKLISVRSIREACASEQARLFPDH